MVKKFSAVIAALVFVVLGICIHSFGKSQNVVEKTEVPPTEIIASSMGEEELVPYKEFRKSSPYKDPGNSEVKAKTTAPQKITVSSDKKKVTSSPQKSTASSPKKSTTASAAVKNPYKEILAIGDSIMVGLSPYLKKAFNNITVNGKVSRQMSDALRLVPSYTRFNSSDRAVIVELGTNGFITEKQIDSLLNSFSKAHVYLVNTRVPRRWESTVNKILRQKAQERGNVTLVDWYSLAIKHPEYFGGDGVHLKSSGAQALTNLISRAVGSK